MRKLTFLLRALRALSPGRFFRAARQIARENNRMSAVIFFDLIWCALRYGAGHTDYRAMGFAHMHGWRRKTFVTRGVNNDYIRRLNKREAYHKLENKATFNALFSDYIGREWCDLQKTPLQAFADFAQRHAAIIVKPVDKLCGQGIEKHEISPETDMAGLYGTLLAGGQTLAEECIVQQADLSLLYPHSVNTLRLITVRADDATHIVFRVFRIGAGGSVIDNTDAGGLCAFPDDKGTLVTHGINYAGEIFENHPDTGVPFEGFVLPFFAEAEAMVKRAAQVVPELRYIGWDVAFTQNGPVLVEANHNPAYSSFQTVAFMQPSEMGKRPVFNKIFENIR